MTGKYTTIYGQQALEQAMTHVRGAYQRRLLLGIERWKGGTTCQRLSRHKLLLSLKNDPKLIIIQKTADTTAKTLTTEIYHLQFASAAIVQQETA